MIKTEFMNLYEELDSLYETKDNRTIKCVESLESIKTSLQSLGFNHSVNGIEHLFKTDNNLSNFIRFDLDDENKILRVKGFGIGETGKGLGGKVINTIFSNIPDEYTVEIENNFNPDFWSHVESKYPNLKFKDVVKVYEGSPAIKESKELESTAG